LLELLGDAARAQKPATKRKPVYTKNGQRLGKLALWT
jgi:hypothetical protein